MLGLYRSDERAELAVVADVGKEAVPPSALGWAPGRGSVRVERLQVGIGVIGERQAINVMRQEIGQRVGKRGLAATRLGPAHRGRDPGRYVEHLDYYVVAVDALTQVRGVEIAAPCVGHLHGQSSLVFL